MHRRSDEAAEESWCRPLRIAEPEHDEIGPVAELLGRGGHRSDPRDQRPGDPGCLAAAGIDGPGHRLGEIAGGHGHRRGRVHQARDQRPPGGRDGRRGPERIP